MTSTSSSVLSKGGELWLATETTTGCAPAPTCPVSIVHSSTFSVPVGFTSTWRDTVRHGTKAGASCVDQAVAPTETESARSLLSHRSDAIAAALPRL